MSDAGASDVTTGRPPRTFPWELLGLRENAPKRNALVVLCYLLVITLFVELLLLFVL